MATGEPGEKPLQEKLPQYQSSVLATSTYLFNNPSFSDVTFVLNEDDTSQKKFYAHKFYLLIRSPVFESLFRCYDQDKEIVIADVKPQGFETMLRYLYTDNMNLKDIQQAFEAHSSAKKYMLAQMEEQCEKYIISKITPESVCDVYQSDLRKNMPKVWYQCLKMIDKKTKEVLQTSGFLNSKIETLLKIVKRPNLTVDSEYEIFKALVNWSGHECIRQGLDSTYNLRTVLEPLLPHVRFLSLFPIEFATIVEKHDIFETSEAFPILMKLLLPNSSTTLPEFLNCKMNPRHPSDCFTCRPYISREQQPCGGLQENDVFLIKFKILNTDIFLLGISLPVLQPVNYNGWPKITTLICVEFLKSNKPKEEYFETFTSHGYREPVIQFPKPIYVEENEIVQIKAEIQDMEKSTFVALYRYQEMVAKYQQQEAEFILIPENDLDSTMDVFQITSLRYYM